MICQNLCISYLMFLSIASVTYISINNMKPFDLSSEAMFSGLLHIQYVLLYSLKLVYVLNCIKMEKIYIYYANTKLGTIFQCKLPTMKLGLPFTSAEQPHWSYNGSNGVTYLHKDTFRHYKEILMTEILLTYWYDTRTFLTNPLSYPGKYWSMRNNCF